MAQHTVVVIEDEPFLRSDAVALFEAAGLRVVDFADGDEAIDFLRTHQAEIAGVFTDVKVDGDTDGLELASIVAEACPHIAVVVTSGNLPARPSDLSPQIRYLSKPWRPADVLRAMKEGLEPLGDL